MFDALVAQTGGRNIDIKKLYTAILSKSRHYERLLRFLRKGICIFLYLRHLTNTQQLQRSSRKLILAGHQIKEYK